MELPTRRHTLAAIAIGVAIAAGIGTATRLQLPAASAAGPSGEISPPSPGIKDRKLIVDVAGAVRSPGVYELAEGSRARDAIRQAGGATDSANTTLVNRAAPLVDGQHLVIPDMDQPVVPTGASTQAGAGIAATAPVSINLASAIDLEQLPGVGPATAAAIVADRDEGGPFASVDELERVAGIGPATIEGLRDMATI